MDNYTDLDAGMPGTNFRFKKINAMIKERKELIAAHLDEKEQQKMALLESAQKKGQIDSKTRA